METSKKMLTVKPEIKKILNKYEYKKFPISSIVGIMHICEIENNCKTDKLWASGPHCWHIDGVIKFNNPIKCKGSLSFWNPPLDMHKELEKEITGSLFNLKFFNNKCQNKKDNLIIKNFKETYKFPDNLVNFIIGDKLWDNKKIILEYINILPPNTTVIIRTKKGIEDIISKELEKKKLKVIKVTANWKNGSKAGQTRNENIFVEYKDILVTVFQHSENKDIIDIIKLSKKYGVRILIITHN
jgi:hypothetical protein